ncbi:sulfotransferase family protein [Leptolyngbya sp. FACHB-541]|uniref:sulfotransferase family protein n=1 Tax=Leptolyngbya sp. FACHB-541 TaxID=2692810 RepID=UPI0016890E8A|nr:sulfotransferase family protein [Leptolyngbya sp. FACHB-541]MBD1995237.1 sulfotransferase family protein [Leptolyngbya sp. FACHB-541]
MLKVVGAGLGRTGTKSLKFALERLLGKPCYHMSEVFSHPEHIPLWCAASRGERIDWSIIFDGYVATVDWPSSSFWFELSTIYPNSLIILSHRDADLWWQSASSTIFPRIRKSEGAWRSMINELFENKFTLDLANRSVCIEAFDRHNELVRNSGLGQRLLEWEASNGWEPLCRALDLEIPEEAFPHENSTATYIQKHL